ncbi:unnamed protein product [Mytilus edulis]|uniref:THAP-type domain-containing protein n=1 Tax=Mytilus edulis TaxID=6550 RepID=A0A8S3PV90_MYTED|nr:unnamed protein product [Mytilus edulis]
MVNFHCIAEGCSNDSRKKHNAVKYPNMILNGCIVDFHVLPSVTKNPKLRKLWLSQIRREGFNPDPNCHWHALCSRHFIEGRPTKENAVPTLFAYNNYKTGTPRDTKNSTLRPIEQLILTIQPANIVTVSQLPKVPRQKKYIPDIPVISYIEKPSLDHTYCTGTEVSEDVSIEEKCVILIENSNTLESTISRVFTTWISLMAQCLGPLIKWPSKEKIKKHMPLSFRRKYPNTRVIIDATEFYVQRPRNPTAQSKTWSNYKSKNTFKTLVGITPNGAFSFISDLWTGNISDRSITERSGFIDLIEKGIM